jgi:acyl-CoA synthetase (AMP-forming)/AMP-acid ligase II
MRPAGKRAQVRHGADGFLRLTGRASDLIIRGGMNISAVAVEAEASTHPAIALAAAIRDAPLGRREGRQGGAPPPLRP